MNKFLLFIFLIASLSSCISAKRTTQFQGEISNNSKLYKLENLQYKLQVNDVLSIGIKAEDPKLVALFGASETSGNSSGGNLYFNGYTVDRHGNIRIPLSAS